VEIVSDGKLCQVIAQRRHLRHQPPKNFLCLADRKLQQMNAGLFFCVMQQGRLMCEGAASFEHWIDGEQPGNARREQTETYDRFNVHHQSQHTRLGIHVAAEGDQCANRDIEGVKECLMRLRIQPWRNDELSVDMREEYQCEAENNQQHPNDDDAENRERPSKGDAVRFAPGYRPHHFPDGIRGPVAHSPASGWMEERVEYVVGGSQYADTTEDRPNVRHAGERHCGNRLLPRLSSGSVPNDAAQRLQEEVQ
jgi:hypothetical protein